MPGPTSKTRAVALAALMVLSVFGGTIAFAGGAVAASHPAVSNNEVVFQGQIINATGFGPGNAVNLRRKTSSGSQFVKQYTADSTTGNVTVDTSDLSAGTYSLNGTGGNSISFEVAPQTLSVDPATTTVSQGNYDNFSVSSNRGTPFPVNITASGLSQDQLHSIFEGSSRVGSDAVQLNATSGVDIPANFTGIDTGSYNFTVSATHTTANDTAQVTVQSSTSARATFPDNVYNVAQGDMANITIDMQNTKYAQVAIGDYANSNFQQNVTVEDANGDGKVYLHFNTFAAGKNASAAVSVGSGDTLVNTSLEQPLTGILDTGDYQLAVKHGRDQPIGNFSEVLNNPDNGGLSTLYIKSRSLSGSTGWVGSPDTSLTSASDIYSAVSDGTLTQGNTVAKTDGSTSQYVLQV